MTPPEDNEVQCAGECREWVDAADLDDLGLCESCGWDYYGDHQDDDEVDLDADF